MPVNVKAKLVKKEALKKDVFKFSVEAKEIVDISKPGHFIEIRVSDQVEPFLRRPISIYNMDRKTGILEFIFQVKGKGTKILSNKQVGDEVDIIGPLGNGKFDYSKMNQITIEARQKLAAINPETLAQASRIPGVSPCDINVLLVLMGR